MRQSLDDSRESTRCSEYMRRVCYLSAEVRVYLDARRGLRGCERQVLCVKKLTAMMHDVRNRARLSLFVSEFCGIFKQISR